MEQILGLVLPWLLIAAFWRPADGLTSWRYYLAPGLAAAAGLVGVFSVDAGSTPDFWVGVVASLAAVAASSFVLVLQSFMPLEWWVRPGASSVLEHPVDPAA